MILFKPKFDEADAEHPEFHLTLSKKQNYDIVRGIRPPVLRTHSHRLLDVREGWRKAELGSHQAAFHHNARVQWFSEAGPQAITQPKHTGDHAAELRQPANHGHLVREAGRFHRRVGDKA